MNGLKESLLIELPQDLSQVAAAAARVLAWCRIHGVPAETLARIELPLVETANNAIRHGCEGRAAASVEIRTSVTEACVRVEVTDPGHFVPGPEWVALPDDPLSESGRGGFLVQIGTDRFEHLNGTFGHTLALEWDAVPSPGFSLIAAAGAEEITGKLTEELANSFETLLGITHFTSLLATTADFGELLIKVRERLESMLQFDAIVARFVEKPGLRLQCIGACPTLPDSVPEDSPWSEATCARTGRARVGTCRDLLPEDPLARFGEQLCLLPVDFGGKRLGTLAALRGAGGQPFKAAEVELLQAVADFIGVAKQTDSLWRERDSQLRLEQEIRVAASIQATLLPSEFPVSGMWEVHGACAPAREVGGDYFDVIPRPDGSLVLLIADVMGKGVPASLVAAMLRSSIRALAPTIQEPGAILCALNRQLFPDLERLGMFITAVLVSLPGNPAHSVTYANAGHCSPVVLGDGCAPEEDANGDVPIGVLPDTPYRSHRMKLNLGQRLMLYTDGCYEVPDAGGAERVGRDAFIRAARSAGDRCPRELVTRLLDPSALNIDRSWIGDDRTLLIAAPRQ